MVKVGGSPELMWIWLNIETNSSPKLVLFLLDLLLFKNWGEAKFDKSTNRHRIFKLESMVKLDFNCVDKFTTWTIFKVNFETFYYLFI